MATTVGNFSAIDDTEVDAESPVTETLVTRLRDNSYWINAGTNKTTQASSGVWLEADGSGGVRWTTPATINGTKGTITHAATLQTSYNTITTATSGILIFNYTINLLSTDAHAYGSVKVDLSDDTFVASGSNYDIVATTSGNSVFSGTITTGQQVGYTLDGSGADNTLLFRRDSGNLQYASGGTNQHLYGDWIIL